jgi:hypothetical protein
MSYIIPNSILTKSFWESINHNCTSFGFPYGTALLSYRYIIIGRGQLFFAVVLSLYCPPPSPQLIQLDTTTIALPSFSLTSISLLSRCTGGGRKGGGDVNRTTTKKPGFLPLYCTVSHTQKEMNLWVKSVRGWIRHVLARYFLHDRLTINTISSH